MTNAPVPSERPVLRTLLSQEIVSLQLELIEKQSEYRLYSAELDALTRHLENTLKAISEKEKRVAYLQDLERETDPL